MKPGRNRSLIRSSSPLPFSLVGLTFGGRAACTTLAPSPARPEPQRAPVLAPKQQWETVGLNVQSMVGGNFVVPGDRVDIVCSVVGKNGVTHDEIVLRNVLVVGGYEVTRYYNTPRTLPTLLLLHRT